MSSASRRQRREHPVANENLDIDLPDESTDGDLPCSSSATVGVAAGDAARAAPRPGFPEAPRDTLQRAAESLDMSFAAAMASPASEIIADLPAVRLLLPLADPRDSQASRVTAWHVDVQLRDAGTRRAFMRLWAGLDHAGARLKDGRRVISYADAVKWMLERIEAVDRAERPEIYDARHNPTFPGK